MPHIACLAPHVADLIAAGEVVERPASVVKELLENAIDAGACAIVTEVEHGGLTYLRISDNGCGIAPEELPVAFVRHATSKLRTAEELAAIGTLGFRGEALAAVSAVSRLDIFTRTAGADTGAQLHLEGGVPGEAEEVGCPEGTTLCVRDLFYNTPARLKFMRKDAAEGAAVAGIVQHLALSHPEVSFRLLRDGEEVLHTPGDGQLLSAVYAAVGRDFALSLLPVEGCGGEVQVQGFVTRPLAGHGSRGKQMFFVNGRFVKSQLLTAALEEAYRNQIMKGKFPGCVLHITLPVTMVDVNVHPAKTVVKFVSEKAAFDAVYYTVLAALEKDGAPRAAAPAPAPASVQKKDGTFFQTMTAQAYRDSAAPPAQKKPLGSFTAAPPRRPSPDETLHVRDVAGEKDVPFTVTTPRGGVYEITPPQTDTQQIPTAPQTQPAHVPEAVQASMSAPLQPAAPPAPVQETLLPAGEAPWRIVGEVLKTYIICEDEKENMWLIDKHAAHERMRFDALKAGTQPLMPQLLLVPAAVSLEAEEYGAVLEHLALLNEFAFCCEDFGPGTVLVREAPADMDAADIPATLEELARRLVQGRSDPAAARDALLHTIACKSAIKAGMTTDETELRALADEVQSGAIRYCPHGRPVACQMSKYELEKLFKRA